jgi:hypothetical protein
MSVDALPRCVHVVWHATSAHAREWPTPHSIDCHPRIKSTLPQSLLRLTRPCPRSIGRDTIPREVSFDLLSRMRGDSMSGYPREWQESIGSWMDVVSGRSRAGCAPVRVGQADDVHAQPASATCHPRHAPPLLLHLHPPPPRTTKQARDSSQLLSEMAGEQSGSGADWSSISPSHARLQDWVRCVWVSQIGGRLAVGSNGGGSDGGVWMSQALCVFMSTLMCLHMRPLCFTAPHHLSRLVSGLSAMDLPPPCFAVTGRGAGQAAAGKPPGDQPLLQRRDGRRAVPGESRRD